MLSTFRFVLGEEERRTNCDVDGLTSLAITSTVMAIVFMITTIMLTCWLVRFSHTRDFQVDELPTIVIKSTESVDVQEELH
jgi:hypothetical protein